MQRPIFHCFSVATVSVAFIVMPANLYASPAHMTIDADQNNSWTRWTIERDKQDGTENDVCVMTADWMLSTATLSLMKVSTESYYRVRVYDPRVHFLPSDTKLVTTVFNYPDNPVFWRFDSRGIGSVYDTRVPGGTSFDTFIGEFLGAKEIGFILDSNTALSFRIGETKTAYSYLQDCIVSITTGDGRW